MTHTIWNNSQIIGVNNNIAKLEEEICFGSFNEMIGSNKSVALTVLCTLLHDFCCHYVDGCPIKWNEMKFPLKQKVEVNFTSFNAFATEIRYVNDWKLHNC